MASYKGICLAAVLMLLTQDCELQLNVCGVATLNSRIVGGQNATPGSWPWQVSLQTSGSQFCGGSLINSQWVLCAAHCFQSHTANSVTVYLGRQRLQGSNPNEVSRTITQVIKHPNYNYFPIDNDISLLKLSSPVNFTNYIQPVCLAASNSTFYNDTNTWVTGWGDVASGVYPPFPQNLMEVQIPIVGNRQCYCDYGVGTVTDNMVCAGLPAGGKGPCQGDSGGPMVTKQNGRCIQAGIVSFGEGCAEPNFPAVFTRVSRYQTWINSQITSNQPGFITFTSNGTDSDLSVSCPGLPPVTPTTTTTTNPPPKTTTTTTYPTSTTQLVVCGQAKRNSRLLGGTSDPTDGLWPWMVSLQKNGSHVCGGTLVAVDSVLSNANCFSSSPVASQWTVVLGRLKQNGSNPFEVTLNVTNITLSNTNGTNIAILHLSARPTLTDYIQPICLDNGQTFAEGSGDSGGPLMCNLGGSWFQAAVLTTQSSSARKRRAPAFMSMTRLNTFKTFLTQELGTLLSAASTTNTTNTTNVTNTTTAITPTTVSHTSGGPPAHSFIFVFFHLLSLAFCLQLFL